MISQFVDPFLQNHIKMLTTGLCQTRKQLDISMRLHTEPTTMHVIAKLTIN